jgi:hypothetical protein
MEKLFAVGASAPAESASGKREAGSAEARRGLKERLAEMQEEVGVLA